MLSSVPFVPNKAKRYRSGKFEVSSLKLEAGCTNEANSLAGRQNSPCRWDQACETKPISRLWREWTRAGRGKGAIAAEPDRTKRSQFPPARQEGQALCRKGVMVNWTCRGFRQNKANSAGWDAAGGATSGAVAWAQCAKQTQFAPDGPAGPSPRPEALTMPPARGKRAKQSQFLAGRPIVQNEPNSSIVDCGLATDLRRDDRWCKTNPISGEPRCPPFQSDAYRAKRSQFGQESEL